MNEREAGMGGGCIGRGKGVDMGVGMSTGYNGGGGRMNSCILPCLSIYLS